MSKSADSLSRRVLITDGEERASLAACRALRSTGYAVDAIASGGPAVVHWSRYCSRRLWAPDPRADRAAFADSLSESLARRRYDLLLPTSDAALLAISEDRDRLSQLVTIGLPGQEAILRCLSKITAFEESGATYLAAPRTEVCRTLDETREAATEIGFPLLVKPRMSARPQGMGLRERSSRRVSSESELAATIEDFGMPVLVQRCLRGPVYSLGGVITDQGLVAAAYSRYVRTWPPDAGNVSCSVSLPLPAQLREAAAGLLDRLGWRGIFELELMEKPDGDLGLIDLNPRVYGSLELAVHAGASLPAIWCDSLLGDPVVSELRDARAGVWYRWEDADVRYALRRLRSGGMRDVARVLRPRRGTAHALFRLSDPGPLFARVISAVRRRRQPRRQNHQPQPGAEYKTPTAGFRAVSLDAEVAVIGAGPYGLACTRFLKKAGVDVLTFGEKMRFWQERMPEQMILRSRRRSSHIADPDGSLSLDAFAAEHGHPRLDPVPLTEFERYGAWYGERAVPDLDGRRIIAVVPRGERSFTLRLEDGAEPTVSRVIVAAGISPFAWRDSPLAELPDELVSHSSYHRNFGRFRGRSVVVVGCGQSALESAALLHEERAAVELIARRPAPVWLGGDADSLRARVRARMAPPTDVGGRVSGWLAAAPGVMRASPSALREWTTARCIVPAGAEWLPERVRDVTMTMDCQIRSAEARNGTVWISLDDGSEREVDHAILATGWRIDVARYPFLDRSIIGRLELRNGYPVLGPGFESSIPGLHFVGTAAAMSFGPINRFVVGSWYAAPVIARAASGKRQRPLRLSYRPRRGRLTVN